MREQVPEKASKAKYIGVFGLEQSQLDLALALEAGRIVSRDVGGSDPERMAAARYLLICTFLFLIGIFKGRIML